MTKSNYLLKVNYWNRRQSILIFLASVFYQGVASSFKCLEGATDQLLLPPPRPLLQNPHYEDKQVGFPEILESSRIQGNISYANVNSIIKINK